MRLIPIFIFAVACPWDHDDDDTTPVDVDGDGYDTDSDCNDADPAINPSAIEVCGDGTDNDCDGTFNECGVGGDVSATAADAILRGEAAGDRASQGDPGFGGAGDVNGDGYGDIIVGALRDSTVGTYSGAAYVLLGPVSGEASLGTANAKILGEAAGDQAGRGVAGVGDLDGDGFDDLFVGALGEDSGGSDAGASYLVSGPVTGTSSLSAAQAKFVGESADDIACEVAWVGDVDGDSLPDLLIGAQYNDASASHAGAAYVFTGPVTGTFPVASADAVFLGDHADDEAGSSLWGAGDLDSDGLNDIAIGARGDDANGTDSGTVFVVYAPFSGTMNLSVADAWLTGEGAGDQIGWGVSVSSAGDVNDDGYDDLVIGARYDDDGATDAGGAYLVAGPVAYGITNLNSATAKLVGEAAGDFTGDSVSGAGDVDGDGFDDVVVGSGYQDSGASNGGAVYLVSGPITGTVGLADAASRLLAEGAEDRARAQGAGDLDSDGYAEIMMGSMLNDEAGADAGAAYIFYGGGF